MLDIQASRADGIRPYRGMRHSTGRLVKKCKIFSQRLFEKRFKPPVGADTIRPSACLQFCVTESITFHPQTKKSSKNLSFFCVEVK
jgi:hypothetical protein